MSLPILSRPHLEIGEREFYIDIRNTAKYFVEDGSKITVQLYENTDDDSVMLFLNGSVLGAVLHQKKMLSFHGSAFCMNGKGILVCGSSGSGKSSVTAAFCQQEGATFISDDITPITIEDSTVKLVPLKTKLKLWEDSLQKLNIVRSKDIRRIRPTLEKYTIPYPNSSHEHQLDHLIVLGVHNQSAYQSFNIQGIEKYNILRNQIYRKSFLNGMPETEKYYFKQLLAIASNIKVTFILRPQICDIYGTAKFIKEKIDL
ncbi:MAG: hypothetical protein M0R23_05055 [Bacteroidales bacterium]|nr:hypothetical protein [Bacteroidales bacterium]